MNSNNTKSGKTTTALLVAVILVAVALALYLFVFNSNARYKKLIKQANKEFSAGSPAAAKIYYLQALEVKPEEDFPKEQIIRIDKKLAEMEQIKIYNEKIQQADLLFEERKYDAARDYYFEALNINADDDYPVDQIKKIQEMLARVEEKPNKPEKGSTLDESLKYYHVVVGVFERDDFALRMNKKLLEQGIDSKILEREKINMKAVTYGSFENIHAAFNMMKRVKNDLYPEAWVLYQ
jgi:cell division protein FtsN